MLLTKLHKPSTNRNLVNRIQLYKKLDDGLTRKLILISAPAGFGKSTIISDWTSQKNIATAWFSIDNNDNDIVDFITYIIYAIRQLHPNFGDTALELIKSNSQGSIESAINILINDSIEIKQDILLVLDDYHLITNSEINNMMGYLIDFMPENLHLAIISRSDPNLSIAKFRSQFQLIELRSADLSFSENDIASLFNKHLKTKLSQENIHSLKAKTEGWIAGLQLAALSMQAQEDTTSFIEAFAGNNRYIMDYLIEEVLKIQPDDIKNFLLQTSILEQFSAPLCNFLLNRNDSQQIVEHLENNNMFIVPLDNERNWYRYHHLFADLLKQRILNNDKQDIAELHNKASLWFEQHNMPRLAISHALANNDFTQCVDLIGKHIEQMWEEGFHSAIIEYGKQIPDSLIFQNPQFSLYYAWILIASGQRKNAVPFIKSAEEEIDNTLKSTPKDTSQYKAHKILSGKIAVAFAYLYSHEENSEQSFKYCQKAMHHLSTSDNFWMSWAWFSYAITYFANGELHKSKDAFVKAFNYGKETGNIYLISTIVMRMAENEQVLGNYLSAYTKCTDLLQIIEQRGYTGITKSDYNYAGLYFIMGVTQFMWFDLDNAYENIKTAFQLSQKTNDIYLRIMTHMVYSFVLKELNDPDFHKRTRELEEIFVNNDVPPFLHSMFVAWKIYLLCEQSKFDEAKKFFTDNTLSVEDTIPIYNEAAYIAYVRLLILRGELTKAETLIKRLLPPITEGQRTERIIELYVLHSILLNKLGKKEAAVNMLIKSMEIASPEKMLSYYLFNTENIDNILQEALKIQATRKTGISDIFIKNLNLALKTKENKKKSHLSIDLSNRELDTLKQIAENLSNQEIADKLFISLNTVKTHLKNIFIKLNVDNRQKAVLKAKEYGLL